MRSPFHTLFGKIFVWFWVALALLTIAMYAGGRMLAQDPQAARPRRADPFGMVATAAAEVLRGGGQPALERMLEGLERREGLQVFLVRDGREVRGRVAGPGVANVARAAASGRRPALLHDGERMLFAHPLEPAAASGLVLVLRPEPMPRPFGLFLPFGLGGPWSLALLVIVAGLVCLALALWLVAPVRRLREATRRLAAGDLRARTGYGARTANDELEALARDFDGMAERLESLVGAQRQLLSDISHELRSPLARMSVAIGLARTRADASAQPMLDRIERESERLNDLIGQLLQLSRLESRGLPVLWDRVDLADVVEQLVEDARFEAQAERRSVRFESAGPLAIEAHADLLRRAIENVLRNALRYTPPGGAVEVAVGAGADPGDARVVVRDHGPGVPADQLEAIFRPFHRVEQARDRGSGGTGLGLAIARRAVEAHGGGITARAAPGGGLEVELRLPRQQLGAPRD